MSQLKVNALVSYSGNTVTLGTTGDTINVASGVTFNTASATVNLPSTLNVTTLNATTISATTLNSSTLNVTTVVLAAGAVGTPSLTTSGDTNTGIFFPSADTIAFTEGGSEAMRIDSSGNVGIGTTSPNGILELKSSSNTNFFITAGNTSASQVVLGDPDDIDVGKISYSHNINAMEFVVNAAERMRIDSSGDVGIGTSVALSSSRLSVFKINNPCIGVQRGGTDGQIIVFGRASDGTLVGNITTTSSSTAYNTSSDYRLKENVNYNFDATTRLKQLKPARFNFIEEPNKTVDGFLAHEVSEIVPEAIHGTKDQVEAIGNITDVNNNIIQENVTEPYELPENQTWTQTGTRPVYQGIDQAKLTPILTKALQEAIAKIESLEARLTALENN